MTASVFISYSRRDSRFVARLYEVLSLDRKVWIDYRSIRPSTQWWEEIKIGIESSDNFLFILSPSSAKSRTCGLELKHAVKLKKKIVPVLHKPVDAAPQGLNDIHWLHFSKVDESTDFNEAIIASLNECLDINAEDMASHTWLLLVAKHWSETGRDPSSLLRGKELQLALNWLATTDDSPPHPTQLHREFILKSQATQLLCERCATQLPSLSVMPSDLNNNTYTTPST